MGKALILTRLKLAKFHELFFRIKNKLNIMRKHIILPILVFVCLFFAQAAKSQDLYNFNLYMQNFYLYIEGAPKTSTFGFRTPIKKNMGLGVYLQNSTQGVSGTFTGRLSYGYRANLGDEHYLNFGLAMGAVNDRLLNERLQNVDLTDSKVATDYYNSTTFNASGGVGYFFKGLEAQFILPQLFEKSRTNMYAIGILAYNYEASSIIDLKPLVLVRGVRTAPVQFDAGLTATWRKTIWGSATYRSNNGLIFGVGANFFGLNLGYAYQADNKTIRAAEDGTHEIQLIYTLGKLKFNRTKSIPINLTVKSVVDAAGLVSEVKVTNAAGEEVSTSQTNEAGLLSLSLKQGQAYTLTVTAVDYFGHLEQVTIAAEELSRNIDVVLTPIHAAVTGKVTRIDNNSAVETDVEIWEAETTIANLHANSGQGIFATKLKSGKTFIMKINDKRFLPFTQTFTIPERATNYSVPAAVLTPYVTISGTLKSKTDNSLLTGTVSLSKSGAVVQTVNTTGNYSFTIEKGAKYELEFKAAEHIGKKTVHNLTTVTKYEITNNVVLEKMAKGAFTLGTINFKSGTAELTEESYETLDKLVEILSDNPDLKIEIAGHTDSDGAEVGNQKISQLRAQACVDYAVNKGIKAERMKAIGFGETKPLVPNNSPENKAKNRRVEFKFID